MSNSEIEFEQQYLTALYAQLDGLRAQAAAGAAGPDAGAFWPAEVARLAAVEEGLCFGRLDRTDGQRVYIGRLGLFVDGQEDPLLVDWRAPVAQPFYTATAAAPHGVRRRRRISTRGRQVIALNDEPLTGPADPADHLVGDGALLAALTRDRTGRMADIVTTLQAEQDQIIRDEYAGALVVQGGPGTGKTAVALHRLAYLLYTRPHLRTRGVLVVGPSQIFLDYIGQVLPGLGEHAVVTATIPDLGASVELSRVDPPEVAERKGRAELAERLRAYVRSRVWLPEEPVDVEFEQQALRLHPADCQRAVDAARQTGLPYLPARLVCQRALVDTLTRYLVDRMEAVVLDENGAALDGGSPDGRLSAADVRGLARAGVIVGPEELDVPRPMLDEVDTARLRDALLADAVVRGVLDEVWPPLTSAGVVAEVLDQPAGDWSAADIPLLDEAATLLGEQEGLATFGHVVVDEAQELSAMAWRMVLRRCPTRSMTIVGDVAQTSTPAGATSWAGVLRPRLADRWRLAQLHINYRTPAEIMAATEPLFARHHPDLRPPRSIRSTGERPWRLPTTVAELPAVLADVVARHDAGRLAVLAPDAWIDRLAPALGLATRPDLTDPVVLLTPERSKGLEFDAVLIVDPAAMLASELGYHDLYVAMTRATRSLGVLHPGPVPAELAGLEQRLRVG